MEKYKVYIDANWLIYFKNKDSPYNIKAQKIIKKIRQKGHTLCYSTLTLDEFLYGLKKEMQRANVFKYKLLEKCLYDILKIPHSEVISTPTNKNLQLKIIKYMKDYNLKPRDSYHLLTAESNNIEYLSTTDGPFKKVVKDERVGIKLFS